jgi:hypothetical protein
MSCTRLISFSVCGGGVILFHPLNFCAVLDGCGYVGGMLLCCWVRVLVFCGRLRVLSGHVCVDMAVDVVPCEFDTAEECALPVNCNCVVLLQCLFEVDHVGFVCYLDAEVIDNKTENNVAKYVLPEAWGVLALVVPFLGKALFKELVGKDAGLREAIHPFSNLDVYPSIFVDKVSEVVAVDDFFGDDAEL